MKKWMILTLFGAAAVCPATGWTDELETVYSTIRYLQPGNPEQDSSEIARAVIEHARSYQMDWELMVAILYQESSLKKDPKRCYQTRRLCKDLGIAQIHWATWGKALHLDRTRLLTDVSYNIQVASTILDQYRRRFQAKETHWFRRYHSGNPEESRSYLKKIVLHNAKIKAYVDARRRNQEREDGPSDLGFQAFLHAGGCPSPVCLLFGPGGEVCGEVQSQRRGRRALYPRG